VSLQLLMFRLFKLTFSLFYFFYREDVLRLGFDFFKVERGS